MLEWAQIAALNTHGDTSKLAAAIQDARQTVVANDVTTAHQRIADVVGMLPASHR